MGSLRAEARAVLPNEAGEYHRIGSWSKRVARPADTGDVYELATYPATPDRGTVTHRSHAHR